MTPLLDGRLCELGDEALPHGGGREVPHDESLGTPRRAQIPLDAILPPRTSVQPEVVRQPGRSHARGPDGHRTAEQLTRREQDLVLSHLRHGLTEPQLHSPALELGGRVPAQPVVEGAEGAVEHLDQDDAHVERLSSG